jgi:hypothetical protein
MFIVIDLKQNNLLLMCMNDCGFRSLIIKKKNIWGFVCTPTQPFRAALSAERSVLPAEGNHNGRSRTATSRSQQQVRTKRRLTSTVP